jgi:hypothetical protein
MHAGGDHGGVQDKTLVTRTLTDSMSRGRFLLVLDDVWNDKAWNNVLRVPIMKGILKEPGSRVLITTRFGDLAQKMQASVHQHDVTPLDQEDAWSLLKIQLPSDKHYGRMDISRVLHSGKKSTRDPDSARIQTTTVQVGPRPVGVDVVPVLRSGATPNCSSVAGWFSKTPARQP